MAARIRLWQPEKVRAKIQASQLINRLGNHSLGKLKNPMDATQVKAAEILLKKVLPDLTKGELTGADGDPLQLAQIIIIDNGRGKP